ncbi:DUF424 domain-containing protein [Pyrofollis japonicus]|uniref:DUF424 domain-containing protein n=1 Tax=Pyrofollis japonicus TaxID=3060460 RepID=UPI00295B9B53|nr:DUF424 family protein [Pyrofollis japonicus]BEP18011.1 DUF424 domain-containing protein [Pyrofollis japonicus]
MRNEEPLVYMKIHEAQGEKIIAICDKDLLGKRFSENNLVLDVNKYFYGGILVPLSVAMEKAEEATILNLVGINTINAAIKRKLVHPDAVIKIAGVPHAQAVKVLY